MTTKSKLKKKFIAPINSFMRTEAASGVILALCAVVAMIIANSHSKSIYFSTLHTSVIGLSIHHWINDGLMAIFFFVIGMEIKKELLVGELSSVKKATLPIAAALGGMVVPALIYAYINPDKPNLHGWGIPMATDIAFVLGILTLFGKRAPLSLKVFLLALAIVDDLGAVLVIAFFYTKEIKEYGLLLAAVMFFFVYIARRTGIRNYFVYLAIGFVAWCGIFYSGVHATVAGVILGLLTPYSFRINRNSGETFSPLEDLNHKLHRWVSFGIMPAFAFANAGITLGDLNISELIGNDVYQGVFYGLLLGKPIGILLFSVTAVLLGLAALPAGLKWKHIVGASFLGGIGFTMALFISSLSLAPELEVYSKTGIISSSLLAAVVGSAILAITLSKGKEKYLGQNQI